jgi:uncharacterized protein (TIGR01777 family)
MRVVVAGGSGLIGRALVASLLADGHAVTVLTRDPDRARKRLPVGCEIRAWDGGLDPEAVVELEGVEVVVNLCGVPVGPRPWTPGRKREIVASRVRPADALVRAIATLAPADRPKAYVSAAGTDWYTDLDAKPATEAAVPPPRGNPAKGAGTTQFLWTVCDEWERAALRAEPLGVRVALLRTSFVLAPGASLMGLLALPFRLWLGGPLGSGRQWFSWVHIDDVIGLYRLAIADERASGAVNVAAPEPCRQGEFAAAIGRALGRPSRLRVPGFAIRIALRGEATLALGSRRVVPARALELGYRFVYSDVTAATAAALGRSQTVGVRE